MTGSQQWGTPRGVERARRVESPPITTGWQEAWVGVKRPTRQGAGSGSIPASGRSLSVRLMREERRLNEPDRDLTPYVPRLLQSWARHHAERRYDVREATLVHADVSGFTALSERLARRGRIGAELLTDTIDACFSVLLDDAAASGGRLLSFGGDALLLLFEGRDHAARGARASLRMRDSLLGLDPVDAPGGRVRLSMTVGVRTGPTHLLLVGDRHRQLLVCGPAASEVVGLEAAAAPGEVVVDEATSVALPDAQLGAVRGSGRLLLGAADGGDLPDAPSGPAPASLVLPFVPEGLRDHLRQGSDPEHRLVAVAFVGVRGLGGDVVADLEGTWSALDATVRAVQSAAATHGVVFLGADVDEGAAKLILVAGAPTGTGDDAARLLLALRELVEAPPPLPLRLGATIGAVFAGDVGPPSRRTYTVMGDAVNLAARLHATATSGSPIVTRELLEASRTPFEVTELPQITVRGRGEPVTPLLLGPAADVEATASSDELPLLGRDEELAVLAAALAEACRGRGRVVELVGEAGIGKSRLVSEVMARADGVRVVRAAGELYRAATPYAATRPLVLDALGLAPGADDDEVRRRLRAVVAEQLPDLAPWRPLLAQAAGVWLPDTDATAALAARYRRPRLHAAVATLLAHRWGSPTLVVVEDLQWTDQASRDLLADLVAEVTDRPWLVLTTRRELDDTVSRADHAQILPIGPLPASATVALGQGAVDEAPLPPAILEQLTERSGGNPLFLGELIAAARQEGGAGTLPDSVESLIGSRIDRLPSPRRRALRQLSVLGAGFDAALAAEVLEVDDGGLTATLQDVADFVDRDGDEVRFRHNLLRDVAYDGLPFRQRQRLHARAADLLERAGDVSLLSVHAFLAGRWATAWQASVAAGRAAADAYANVDAAQFLTRALRAGRYLRTVGALERAEVAELLGDVQRRLGDTGAATSAYRAARRHCRDEVAIARLSLKQARAQAGGQRFSQALAAISRALGRLDGVSGQRAASQRAELLAWHGHFRQEQGRHAEALAACRKAIAQAEAADATAPLAHALRLLDWIHAERGEFDLAVHSERSLALFTELGDLPNQASVLNNLGGFAYWAGRWEEAAERYRLAQELDERTGDVVGAAFTRNNLAEILADQGRLDEAEALLAEAERTFRGTGYTAGVAYVRMNLGRVAAHAGRHDLAWERLTSALALHREVGASASAFEAEARLAEVALLAGSSDDSLAAADRLLSEAAADGAVAAAVPLLHRIRAAVQVRRGDLAAARDALATSEEVARARDADFEQALTQAAQADVALREGREADAVRLRAPVDATLTRLGVRQVPWDAAGRLPV